ncbi:hypothetical protein Tco_0633698 [Tanacetum coccineum]
MLQQRSLKPEQSSAVSAVTVVLGHPVVSHIANHMMYSTCDNLLMIAMMEGGEYGDSVNFFFGVYHIGSAMSQLSITGGTAKYLHACGFAEVRSLIPCWSDCC